MSFSVYEIPLSAAPQRFNVTLAGVQYQLQVVYCEVDAATSNWTLELFTAAGISITGVLPMVTGVDLLAQLAYLGLGFSLFVLSDGQLTFAIPTFDNLGGTCHLLYVVNPFT